MRTNDFTPELIRNHMSRRHPQYEALSVLHEIMQIDNWSDDLEGKINVKYPIFKEFQRSFPSITFDLQRVEKKGFARISPCRPRDSHDLVIQTGRNTGQREGFWDFSDSLLARSFPAGYRAHLWGGSER